MFNEKPANSLQHPLRGKLLKAIKRFALLNFTDDSSSNIPIKITQINAPVSGLEETLPAHSWTVCKLTQRLNKHHVLYDRAAAFNLPC